MALQCKCSLGGSANHPASSPACPPHTHTQKLDLQAVSTRVRIPFNPKVAAQLAAAWPRLSHLALSCMVPPERLLPPTASASAATAAAAPGSFRGPLQPAALRLLGRFAALRSLCLSAPLPDDYDDDDDEEEGGSDESPEDVAPGGGGGARRAPQRPGLGTGGAGGGIGGALGGVGREPIPLVLSSLPAGLEQLQVELARVLADAPPPPPPPGEAQQEGAGGGGGGGGAMTRLRSLALFRCEVRWALPLCPPSPFSLRASGLRWCGRAAQ